MVSAGLGYILMRGMRPAATLDVRAAFELLDRSIGRYVPELSQGYSWGEAFERLRDSGIRADWDGMGRKLAEYEAFRYGGMKAPVGGQDEVLSLAMKLRRSVVGKGPKGKSAGGS